MHNLFLLRLFYADNTTLNLGSGGDTIATDDISGVKHQYVKLEYGADGVATPVDATNPLPIIELGSQVQTDDAAFTPATSKIVMIGAINDDTATDSVDEGDGGAMRMSSNRNQYVQIRDGLNNERGLQIDELGMTQGTREQIRYAEKLFLQQQANLLATMFVDERASAPNYGFELR